MSEVDIANSQSQEQYYLKSFLRSLKKRLAHRREWAINEQTSGYRLFDRENNIPLTVDFYNDKYAVVTAFLSKDDEWQAKAYLEVITKALSISSDRLFYKERIRGSSRGYEKPEALESLWVQMHEHGLTYKLNLTDYLDVGLFMDHRNLRRELITHSKGLKVLNLFSYTGSLGLSAAAGGAASVINVDLSQRYLEWAKDNFRENGFLGESFSFIRADVLSWLEESQEQYNNTFDIILCDPPAFSNSRNMKGTLNIQRDYLKLIEKCLVLLRRKGGMLYFSSPLQTINFNIKHLRYIQAKEITAQSVPYDFRKSHPHRSWQLRWRFVSGSGYEGDKNTKSYSRDRQQRKNITPRTR